MALSEALSPFVWGAGGSRMTPEQLAKQREIEDALLVQGVDTSPVGHWTQGLARVANAMAGSVRRGRLEKAEAKNASESQSRIAALLGGMGGAQGTANFPAAPGGSTAARDNPDVGSTIDFARAGNSSENKQAFIASLMPAAMEASKRTGVDPRIIVAQAAQETGWGKSAPGNNFFGIKSHGKGGGQNLTTHEVINGQRVKVNDSFRTFGSPADSVAGYADFILENPRYRPLMQAQGLDAQLAALGASGYATDPNYAASVGAIARGIPMPAVAANEAMATGQPIQTASLDPSAGIAEALAEQGLPADGPQAEAFARLHQTTPRSATPDQQFQVGAPGAETPAGQRVLSTMMDPQPMGGAPMPLQAGSAAPQASPPLPSPDMAQAPVAAPQQRVAQAMMGRNEMSGNVDVPVRQGMNPAIIEALSSPYASEQERRIAGILLQQQMEQNDPMRALQMQKLQAEIGALNNPIGKPTDDMREYEFARTQGYGGTFQEFQTEMKRAGATSVNVGAGEKAWDTESAKLFAKKYDDITTQAQSANDMLGLYDMAAQGLDSGVRTGAFGSSEQAVRQLAISLGIGDADKVAAGELITAVQNRMALLMRSPDSGMGMPGAVSDRDLTFLKEAQIGLDRSVEGNRQMLDAFRRLERRKIEIAALADQYVQTNGKLDAGFNQAVREYAKANPLFPQDGAEGVPEGVDPEDWKFMDEESRRLFQ